MDTLQIARRVINIEISALNALEKQLDQQFDKAVDVILNTSGRVIICGMGKSGIIGKKIAASLASTGTPSFFMHPGEAFHGDLGMVTIDDVFIAISNSGETSEVLQLLPFLKDNSNTIIAMTGNSESTLALNALYHLNIAVPEEACPFQLAPTSSTTASLVMGDALTVALMEKRGFQPENFARFHPGGSLGSRLLGNVKDNMHSLALPMLSESDSFTSLIACISKGKLGLAIIKKESEIGLITDGDIRRAMDKYGKNVFNLTCKELASFSPYTIKSHAKMAVAVELMHEKNISSLIVLNDSEVVGVVKK